MLNQIRDVYRNHTLAELAGDFIGAACIVSAPIGALIIAELFR